MRWRHRRAAAPEHRILFPFIGSTLSSETLDATLRLAGAQGATLVPAYLARIPHNLSLDSPMAKRECEEALPLLELIEQRATRRGVPIDSRLERGRTHRHALSALLEAERYDTLVVPARTSTSDGFEPADVAWLLEHAPGQVLVIRPAAAPPRAAPPPPRA